MKRKIKDYRGFMPCRRVTEFKRLFRWCDGPDTYLEFADKGFGNRIMLVAKGTTVTINQILGAINAAMLPQGDIYDLTPDQRLQVVKDVIEGTDLTDIKILKPKKKAKN